MYPHHTTANRSNHQANCVNRNYVNHIPPSFRTKLSLLVGVLVVSSDVSLFLVCILYLLSSNAGEVVGWLFVSNAASFIVPVEPSMRSTNSFVVSLVLDIPVSVTVILKSWSVNASFQLSEMNLQGLVHTVKAQSVKVLLHFLHRLHNIFTKVART